MFSRVSFDLKNPIETVGNYSIHDYTGRGKHAKYVVVFHSIEDGNPTVEPIAMVREGKYDEAIFAMEKLKYSDEVWALALSECGSGVNTKWDRTKAFRSWMF
ncbi:MAG: hypothetical protein AAF485_22355 [Chloroflexota bacterium]